MIDRVYVYLHSVKNVYLYINDYALSVGSANRRPNCCMQLHARSSIMLEIVRFDGISAALCIKRTSFCESLNALFC